MIWLFFTVEIYSDIVFDAPHTSAAQLEGDSLINSDLLAIVSGVSKGNDANLYNQSRTEPPYHRVALFTQLLHTNVGTS